MPIRGLYKILIMSIPLFIGSCKEITAPKPRGYFRIDLPKKEYISSDGALAGKKELPLSFEYPVYGEIDFVKESDMEPGWFNIDFTGFKAKIYFTYMDVNGDLPLLMEETYKMNVKNHIVKADAINEQVIDNPNENVYGILYNLKGGTATAVQFFVTDSVKHFFRGSLYFNAVPNQDSLAPVIDFFKEDIEHLIETLKWKEE